MTPAPSSSGQAEQFELVSAARVARLATVRPDGMPHLVVVTFALVRDDPGTVVTAVDTKPKRSQDLQRLRNIAANPRVSLLVDHYDEDWARLWWVRIDGTANIVTDEPRRTALTAPLLDKYEQYRTDPPAGPVVVITAQRRVGWSATGALT